MMPGIEERSRERGVMRRNDSICPLLTIAANADASNQGTAVPCDPEHCMLARRMTYYDKERDERRIFGWRCGLPVGPSEDGDYLNYIESEGIEP